MRAKILRVTDTTQDASKVHVLDGPRKFVGETGLEFGLLSILYYKPGYHPPNTTIVK